MDKKTIKDFKTVVVYSSKYGTTQQYAKWLSEVLGCDIIDVCEASSTKLNQYDCVIFGAALHAGGIRKINIILKAKVKNLIIFTVGLANPETTDYSKIINKNIPKEVQKNCKIFHLRGGIDYKKLSLIDRLLMSMIKRNIAKKNANSLTDEEKTFLRTYGSKVDFSDKKMLEPLIEYLGSNEKMFSKIKADK